MAADVEMKSATPIGPESDHKAAQIDKPKAVTAMFAIGFTLQPGRLQRLT